MNTSKLHSDPFRRNSFIWPSTFSQRQTKLYPRENRHQVKVVFHSPESSTPATTSTGVSNDDVEVLFVKKRHQCGRDRDSYRQLQIGSFLRAAKMELLRESPRRTLSKPMALLDDRNNQSVAQEQLSGNCRPFRGPLTAQELFVDLSKERFVEASDASATVSAERRLIYITGIDPYYALALAATVSTSQSVFLMEFLCKYLSFHPFLGVDIWAPSTTAGSRGGRGFEVFALEMHLPYYAWRKTNILIKDPRKIRHSEQVMYLPIPGTTTRSSDDCLEGIYQAQVSIMVSGLDDWVWTAYCLVDIYFDNSENPELVEHYCNVAKERMDPHSFGQYPADIPVWDPRQYFLRALSARMEQVTEEWETSVLLLIDEIKPYIHSFPRSRAETNSGQLKTAFRWIILTLQNFEQLLARIIESWEKFERGHIQYFYNTHSGELADTSWATYLSTIEKNVDKLRDLRGLLKDQKELCEYMNKNGVMHAQYAETCIASKQSRLSQTLSYVSIIYNPLNLAVTLYGNGQKTLLAILFFLFLIVTLLVLASPLRLEQFFRFLHNKANWSWARLLRPVEEKGRKMHATEEDSGDEGNDGVELVEMTQGNVRLQTGREAGGEV